MKKILLATDHAGFETKERIKDILKTNKIDFEDLGAFNYEKSDDYPDWISKAAKKVSKNPEKYLAIILGGSGQGEAIVANRFKNVRATVYYGGNPEILKLSKEHNNANVLSIGARFIEQQKLKEIILSWLNFSFSKEKRHKRRIKKIEKHSKSNCILF